MILELPIPDIDNNPYSTSQIPINGKTFDFDFSYNSRAETCFLSISLDDEPIITGIALLPNIDFAARVYNENWQGGLALQDVSGMNRKPTQENLQTDYKLIWTDYLND